MTEYLNPVQEIGVGDGHKSHTSLTLGQHPAPSSSIIPVSGADETLSSHNRDVTSCDDCDCEGAPPAAFEGDIKVADDSSVLLGSKKRRLSSSLQNASPGPKC
jgi:hypothetical protein